MFSAPPDQENTRRKRRKTSPPEADTNVEVKTAAQADPGDDVESHPQGIHAPVDDPPAEEVAASETTKAQAPEPETPAETAPAAKARDNKKNSGVGVRPVDYGED